MNHSLFGEGLLGRSIAAGSFLGGSVIGGGLFGGSVLAGTLLGQCGQWVSPFVVAFVLLDAHIVAVLLVADVA